MISLKNQEECQTPSMPAYVDQYPMYIDYEKSIMFDYSLNDLAKVSGYNELCQEIYNELFPAPNRISNVNNQRKLTIELMISNLIKAAALNKTLAVNLNRNFYSGKYSYRTIKKVLAGLYTRELIQVQNGFSGNSRGRTTRIWMSLKLRAMLHGRKLIPSKLIDISKYSKRVESFAEEPLIELRSENVIIPDSQQYQGLYQFLELYNRQSEKHVLTLPLYEVSSTSGAVNMYTPNGIAQLYYPANDYHFMNQAEQLLPEAFKLQRYNIVWGSEYFASSTISMDAADGCFVCTNRTVDSYSKQSEQPAIIGNNNIRGRSYSFYTITKNTWGELLIERNLSTKLHRVFNIDMTQGGRFYGAGYQRIRKGFRKHLRIDGLGTVEKDYSALHPRMLYHYIGLDYQDDPYSVVCRYLNLDLKTYRGIIKVALNAMLNASNESDAIKGINYSLFMDGLTSKLKQQNLKSQDIIQAIKECHPLIASQFNTGAGLRLMGHDSEIAANVLRHFTDKNILCLCMHDSFIVQQQYEEELIEVMKESYKRKFPFECQIK